MNNCPCCSHTMTRNFRQHHIYWFCRTCWQEMPLITEKTPNTLVTSVLKRSLVTSSRTKLNSLVEKGNREQKNQLCN